MPSASSSHAAPFPSAWTAFDSGSDTFRCSYGTIPVSTSPIATYSTVEMSTVASSPIGTVRCGLRASPAAVETASKPT